MSIARRVFLAGTGSVAAAGFFHGAAANASARSVIELGVEPDTGSDVTDALQNAITELSGRGEAVFLPGGRFSVTSLSLPENSAIYGVPGQTRIIAGGGQPAFTAENAKSTYLSGLTFEGGAISGNVREASIDTVQIANAPGGGIILTGTESAFISRCRIANCAGTAIGVSAAEPSAANSAVVAGNHITNSKTGVALAGSGHITGNTVIGAQDFGLRIGGGEDGSLIADGNILNDCRIGIGLAANAETMLASLNMISGLGAAAESAVRAFSGEELLGPDLAFESAEAYLTLTVVGNIVR